MTRIASDVQRLRPFEAWRRDAKGLARMTNAHHLYTSRLYFRCRLKMGGQDLQVLRQRNAVLSPVPLQAGANRLGTQQAPKADLATSPWAYLMPVAEQRMREAEGTLAASRERNAFLEQSRSFAERECQFQASAGIRDAQTCNYLHLLAQREALRQGSSRSGK